MLPKAGVKMKLLIASNNKKKINELKDILKDSFEVISLREAGVESDPEENGDTFEENARIKAINGMKASGLPCIADDSGLAVDELEGAPGVHSHRYAGEDSTDEQNNELLLKNMENIDNRSARFISAICLVYPDGREISCTGECRGEILREPRGENGFGYDPLFFVKEYNKTFAEISGEIKNKISHRAKALDKFKELIK